MLHTITMSQSIQNSYESPTLKARNKLSHNKDQNLTRQITNIKPVSNSDTKQPRAKPSFNSRFRVPNIFTIESPPETQDSNGSYFSSSSKSRGNKKHKIKLRAKFGDNILWDGRSALCRNVRYRSLRLRNYKN